MSSMVRVAVDAMGGDNAPIEIVKGAVHALEKTSDVEVILVGPQDRIEEELKKYTYPKQRLRVVHASEVIEMAEPPVAAIRSKKDSTMVVGLTLVRKGEADAFVSAGNSGAVMVGGQAIVGRIRGIDRAPFASVIPTAGGPSLLLDCGANVDARSSHLVQFAQMGSIYMRDICGVKNPKVGLVNIGAEDDKGNLLTKETFPLLKECPDINFIGNVEARDIPFGGCDVLVAEGFSGNIVLKMYEGTAKALLGQIKKGLLSSIRTKIGALLIKPAIKDLLTTYDASAYGGAPVIGLKGLVVKTHGNAKAAEITNSILQCKSFKDAQIAQKIEENIASKNPPRKRETAERS